MWRSVCVLNRQLLVFCLRIKYFLKFRVESWKQLKHVPNMICCRGGSMSQQLWPSQTPLPVWVWENSLTLRAMIWFTDFQRHVPEHAPPDESRPVLALRPQHNFKTSKSLELWRTSGFTAGAWIMCECGAVDKVNEHEDLTLCDSIVSGNVWLIAFHILEFHFRPIIHVLQLSHGWRGFSWQ